MREYEAVAQHLGLGNRTELDAYAIGDICGYMMENSIPLFSLLDDREVWSKFVAMQVAEEYRAAISYVVQYGSTIEIFYFLRYWYKMGRPAMSDTEYDTLEFLYKNSNMDLSAVYETTFEGDPVTAIVATANEMVVTTCVKEQKLKAMVLEEGKSAVAEVELLDEEKRKNLDMDKSTSIRPVLTADEAYQFMLNWPSSRVHFSLKVDGVNAKLSVGETGVDIGLSRGRKEDSLSYTEGARMALAKYNIDYPSIVGKVVGEAVVNQTALDAINLKYLGKDYKTPKSAAKAFMSAAHQFEPQDYNGVHFYAFTYEDMSKDIAFNRLQLAGFEVPPSITIEAGNVPLDSLQSFSNWLNEAILTPLSEEMEARAISADGVVIQILEDVHTERKDVYSDANIAIKFGAWAPASYTSRIVGFEFEQRRIEMSTVLLVEPVLTRDNNTASRVDPGSFPIVVSDRLQEGSKIEFTRKSEAYNVYTRKVGQ